MKTTKYNLTAVALTLAVVVISTASSVQAQAVPSDQILILDPNNHVDPHSVTIFEGVNEPLGFIDGSLLVGPPFHPIVLFNTQAGVTVLLEPGSNGGILPSNTTIGLNGIFGDLNLALAGLLGPSAKISDVFGITLNFVNSVSVIGFGLLSDGETNLSIGSFGVPLHTQVLSFAFETAHLESVGNVFLTRAANDAGYHLLVGSDVEAVPEPSTWAFMLSGAGALVLLRRRKRGAAVS